MTEPRTKRFRLSDLDLDFISIVHAGDDPEAQIVISKAAPTKFDEQKVKRGKGKEGGKFVRQGDTGEEVEAIQGQVGTPVDGVFKEKTRIAVMDYQRKHGLVVDGIVGPQTLASLADVKAGGDGNGFDLKGQRKRPEGEIDPNADDGLDEDGLAERQTGKKTSLAEAEARGKVKAKKRVAESKRKAKPKKSKKADKDEPEAADVPWFKRPGANKAKPKPSRPKSLPPRRGAPLYNDRKGTVEKVSSSAYPSLERKKGGPDNWVEAAGGLPSYIERIAKHLHHEQGYDISRAIATAVNTVKRWAAGGTVTAGGGPKVSARTQSQAAKALAQWETKKAA